jgi:hypothetical protein
MRRLIPALLASVVLASSASAEAPWRFRWQTGQVLTYRVEQVTTISEVVGAKQTEVTTRLNLVKRWQVGEVDASGGATLHLSLAAMRNEITRPDGEVLLFDSPDADRSSRWAKRGRAPTRWCSTRRRGPARSTTPARTTPARRSTGRW